MRVHAFSLPARWLARLYVVAAILVCSFSLAHSWSYLLFLPHPVGHLLPAFAIATSLAWAVYIWLIGRGSSGSWLRRGATLLLVLALIAAFVCIRRFDQQVAAAEARGYSFETCCADP